MRLPVALRAKFIPLPQIVTEQALLARYPDKTKRKSKYKFTKEQPEDDVGDLSHKANPLGSHIYFYNHLLNKRVIYSLYQNLYVRLCSAFGQLIDIFSCLQLLTMV